MMKRGLCWGVAPILLSVVIATAVGVKGQTKYNVTIGNHSCYGHEDMLKSGGRLKDILSIHTNKTEPHLRRLYKQIVDVQKELKKQEQGEHAPLNFTLLDNPRDNSELKKILKAGKTDPEKYLRETVVKLALLDGYLDMVTILNKTNTADIRQTLKNAIHELNAFIKDLGVAEIGNKFCEFSIETDIPTGNTDINNHVFSILKYARNTARALLCFSETVYEKTEKCCLKRRTNGRKLVCKGRGKKQPRKGKTRRRNRKCEKNDRKCRKKNRQNKRRKNKGRNHKSQQFS